MPDGTQALKVSVTEIPEDGRANAAVIKLLAKEWGVPKSAIRLVRGDVDRNKVLEVSGGRGLLTRIESWLAEKA